MELPIYVSRHGSDESVLGETINVGSKGVLIRLSEKLSVGERVQCNVVMIADVDGVDGRAEVECLGTIVRRESSDSHYVYAARLSRFRFVRQTRGATVRQIGCQETVRQNVAQ